MAQVQCEKKHFYDNVVHTFCPYCPVPGLAGAKVAGTRAASIDQRSIPLTEPASGARPAVSASGTPGLTVGLFQRRAGIDPVVGWLVCTKGPNKGRDYRLHSDLNHVGRAPSMDVCVEGDDTISRENHCSVAFSPRSNSFSLLPGTGRNTVYLNGLELYSVMGLEPYAEIELGESKFLFLPFCTPEHNWTRINEAEEKENAAKATK